MLAFTTHLSPSAELSRLLASSAEEQRQAGYEDTLRDTQPGPQSVPYEHCFLFHSHRSRVHR